MVRTLAQLWSQMPRFQSAEAADVQSLTSAVLLMNSNAENRGAPSAANSIAESPRDAQACRPSR